MKKSYILALNSDTKENQGIAYSMMHRKIIPVPLDVKVVKDLQVLRMEGPLGSLEIDLQKIDKRGLCFIEVHPSEIHLYVKKTHQGAGMIGTLSSLCTAHIKGITQGFVQYLELVGVGYRAQIVGQQIEFKLGQSHDLIYEVPDGIKPFLVKPTLLGLYGIHQSQVTQCAAQIRNLKLPEPYKGKGIRYKDEVIQTKTGKKK